MVCSCRVAMLLPALFDPGVETAEVDPFADPIGELVPEERALLGRAVDVRALEFRAGRHCARIAMGRLGVGGPILRAADRSPIWPTGIVGSIAHTRRERRGFCGAAVARVSAARAIGLDAEIDRPLPERLWKRILRPGEAHWISSFPESERGAWAMLVFSAKESVYKCQYAVSRVFLEFGDVELLAPHREGEFSATLLRDAPPFSAGHAFLGRYVRADGVLATGVTLAS